MRIKLSCFKSAPMTDFLSLVQVSPLDGGHNDFLSFTWSRVAARISSPEFDSYRLVLICPQTRRVLVERTKEGMELPRILVPRWTRPAEQAQAIAETRWPFKVFIIDFLGEEPGNDGVIVAQIIGKTPACRLRGKECWSALQNVKESVLSGFESASIQCLIDGGFSNRGPFFKLDWTSELVRWVNQLYGSKHNRLIEGVKQFNAGSSSALVRFDRYGAGPLWFKATPPLESEGRITVTLAQEFPAYLPPLIAFHHKWNGWLLEDAGRPLEAFHPLRFSVLDCVVRRLAELQIASIGRARSLLTAGLRDERVAALAKRLRSIAPYVEEAMSAQTVDVLPRVSTARLCQISEFLEQTSSRFEMDGIPDTLIHRDTHLENILIGDAGGVFTDWAKAGVGNPLLTFHQLVVQLAQRKDATIWLEPVKKCYQSAWRKMISESSMSHAFTVVPVLAAASDLCGFSSSRSSETARQLDLHKTIRILARRIDKEARILDTMLPLSA